MSKGLDINVPKSCCLSVRICAYIGLGPKGIYVLGKTYEPFRQNVRTFQAKRTNLSAKMYEPFGVKMLAIKSKYYCPGKVRYTSMAK